MTKPILLLAVFLVSIFYLSAQTLSVAEKKELSKKEDSLKSLAIEIIQGRTAEDRFNADSLFTKMFVRALKIKNSFYYPFDSLITISRLVPPDSNFKIFTWQLVINESVTRQHGAIQMNTADGSLDLLPLIDRSSATNHEIDTIANNFGWMGAVYYKIIQKEAFEKKYYTLLGYDENDVKSNKKVIEVLTFEDSQPMFGGSYFSFPDNSIIKRSFARYVMEYKKDASPRLTFDPEMDMIVYEHLISETGEPDKKYTYIPDGDYEGLKWTDGKWVHINKIFTQVTPEGQAPLPLPIRDAEGNLDDSKLSNRMPEVQGDNDEDEEQPKSKIVRKKSNTSIKIKSKVKD